MSKSKALRGAGSKDLAVDNNRLQEMMDSTTTDENVVGGDYIKWAKTGNFEIDGVEYEGPLSVVVLNFSFSNQLYEGKYNPNDPAPPVCFSASYSQKDLAPLNGSDARADSCNECYANVADSNGARECKNTRRLAIISAVDGDGNLNEFNANAEIKYISLPPTSLSNWTKYYNHVRNVIKRPTFGVVTVLTPEYDKEREIHRMTFKADALLDMEDMELFFDMKNTVDGVLLAGYGENAEKSTSTKKSVKKKVVKKKVAKKKVAAKKATPKKKSKF